jgi:GxxExxY protein
MAEEEIAREIVDAALAVHRELGPGLLESAYEQCLAFELARRGLKIERQKELPIVYQGMKINAGYRIDLLVNDSIIIELKAVDRVEPIHEAQLLSYLRLADRRIGFLINFNVRLLKDGIRRLVLQSDLRVLRALRGENKPFAVKNAVRLHHSANRRSATKRAALVTGAWPVRIESRPR